MFKKQPATRCWPSETLQREGDADTVGEMCEDREKREQGEWITQNGDIINHLRSEADYLLVWSC